MEYEFQIPNIASSTKLGLATPNSSRVKPLLLRASEHLSWGLGSRPSGGAEDEGPVGGC